MERALMGPGWAVAGLIIVVVTVLDEVRTTLGVSSDPGPVTRMITRVLWRLQHRRRRHRWLPAQILGGPGVAMVVVTVGTWFALLWAGWSLVFLGGEGAVVNGSTHAPASAWERFYFAGYTVVTLGNGSYRPVGAGAELTTVAAGLTGMLLITLAVSYLTSVISAVVGKRAFASSVFALGRSGGEAAAGLTIDGSPVTTTVIASGLSTALSTLDQQHQAYPLLHAFRPRSPDLATAPAVAILMDAVLMLSSLSDHAARPPAALRRSVTSAVELYVRSGPQHSDAQHHAPPIDPATVHERWGLALDPGTLDDHLRASDELRHALAGRIAGDGYSWPTGTAEEAGGSQPAPTAGQRPAVSRAHRP